MKLHLVVDPDDKRDMQGALEFLSFHLHDHTTAPTKSVGAVADPRAKDLQTCVAELNSLIERIRSRSGTVSVTELSALIRRIENVIQTLQG